MSTRWWTFAAWTLAAASALFWGLRLFVPAPPVPARTPVAAAGPVVRSDLTRLLGVDPPPPVVVAAAEPAPDARFQLIGVVSPRSSQAAREGLALIAVDGKPAKAFRVGAVVDGQTVLKSVAARGAMLGPRDGAAIVALNIVPPAAAATGVLPSVGVPPQPAVRPPPQGLVPPPGQPLGRVLPPWAPRPPRVGQDNPDGSPLK